MIPSWLRRDERVWPTDVFARAGLSPYAYSLDDVRAPDEILANCLRELAEKPERFVSLLEAFDPEVAAVNFYTLDASSHRFWDDSFPDQSFLLNGLHIYLMFYQCRLTSKDFLTVQTYPQK